MKNNILVLLCLFSVCQFSCSLKYSHYLSAYKFNDSLAVPDYSNLYYWAAHPFKKDPSDSIPQPLLSNYKPDSLIDVFFLYPTSFTKIKDDRWNADINDAYINAKTDYSSILYQASVFNEYRVFAPRYRQANIRSYFTKDKAAATKAFDLAYDDIKNAFQYYLDHYNNNHAIIIASHSQGTTHALRLLKDFFEHGPLKDKLVAAYLVGMYIPDNYFSELKICSDSLQTGCFCGWRTFRTDYKPAYVSKEKGTALVTNPLTWTTQSDFVLSNANRGSVLKKFNKIYYGVAGAQINSGILWTNKPVFPGNFLLATKNYHIGDINLYYLNIRDNVRQRVASFREKTR